ncbi:MAG: MMPL family transporter, partial [Myxococcota bacterium]
DSFAITNSLVPVSGLSLLGVALSFLLFFRRQIAAVVLGLTGMVIGVLLTFGFTFVAVGQLNMITCILGGILMGQGIDFAIHFTYRLAEEIERGRTLEQAVGITVEQKGVASLVSAAGTGAAFFSLLFSEFRGFSQFGLLAGVGVFFIGVSIYLWVPAAILLWERRRPGTAKRMLAGLVKSPAAGSALIDRVPRPRLLLAVASLLAVAIALFAPRVRFEYNTRALMVENQPSVLLQDEMNRRFQISADPVAVYTPTLGEARKVYDLLTPLDPARFSTVDQVASIYTFVPPRARQERNAAILADWRAELSSFDRAMLPPAYDAKWDEAQTFLSAAPYELGGVPEVYRKMFAHLPQTRPAYHGTLTYIYPQVDLWDGRQMLRFADQVETLRTADGATYHAAGSPILFAKLARIVLWDGKLTLALTAVMLLAILLFDLRSVRGTLVALVPLVLGMTVMMGAMALLGVDLNFMNIVVLPIVLGYGISHGVYFIHCFNEGTSPRQALRSVGGAVACSTLTTLAGWAALLAAGHRGLKSMGTLACIGFIATLLVSFTIMPALLQILHDRRTAKAAAHAPGAVARTA